MTGIFSIRGVRGATVGVALACLLLVAAADPQRSAAAVSLKGNASWVWYVSESGGSGDAIGRDAERRGLDAVYVKSGDGTHLWSQFTPALVDEIHDHGIDVCAWQFVYGEDPQAEARVAAGAVAAGADCLIIDAEADYEGRYAAADTFVRALRRRVGEDYPLGLSSFPYVDYHPAFPYSVFLGDGGAQYNLPQVYWRAIGTSVLAALDHTFDFNRPYGRPIFPVGQTWQDPPRRQVLSFRRHARAAGARGVSWWSWQETSKSEWRALTERVRKLPKGDRPARGFAALNRGDEGDLVVWAQELLLGGGSEVRVSGRFDARTKRAVEALQAEAGLPETGEIDDRTWRELLRSPPARIRWSARPPPRFARTERSGPPSTAIEPAVSEIPPLNERTG